jgi:hypothetical protein
VGEAARIRALEARVALLEGRSHDRGSAEVVPGPRVHLLAAGEPGDSAHEERVPPPGKALVPKAVEVDEAALQAEYFGDLDVRLAGETRDPVWAAAIEEKLRTAAFDVRPRINIDSTRCGQTMCRVDANVPDLQHQGAALEKFILSTVALLPEAVVRDGDGPGLHILYFARQGSEFPPMTAPETATH